MSTMTSVLQHPNHFDTMQDPCDGDRIDEEPTTGENEKMEIPPLNQWHSQLSDGSLELSNRALEQIPMTIFEYHHSIKIIYLQDNRLREIPHNFFDDLPHLAWCDLRFNEIGILPNFTKPHNSLRVLMLQDNRLKTLPYSLGIHAVKLKTLGLRGNPFHDPPQRVLDSGTEAIRLYLIHSSKHENGDTAYAVELEREGRRSTQSNDDDLRKRGRREKKFTGIVGKKNIDEPNFAKSLYKSVQRARKTQSQNWSKNPRHESIFGNLDHKTASHITYTNDLWRDIPFDGYSQKELINKSLEGMRSQIMRKFAVQRDKIIQRIKDREVLTKWRFETRDLQLAGRRPGTCALVVPPYGVTTDVVQEEESHSSKALQYVQLDPETFQKEVSNCSKKLQHFIENPTPITDSEAAYRRLQEVEEIQRKLCSMKLSVNCPIPM